MSLSPLTMFLIKGATTLVSTGASIIGQQQQHAAQRDANRRQAESIRRATVENYRQLGARRLQEFDASTDQITEARREGLIQRERAITAAGEAGVSGLSVDALLADFEGRTSRFVNTTQRTYRNRSAQIASQERAAEFGATGQLAALPEPRAPSYFGAAVRAAGGIWSAYDRYLAPDPDEIPLPGA